MEAPWTWQMSSFFLPPRRFRPPTSCLPTSCLQKASIQGKTHCRPLPPRCLAKPHDSRLPHDWRLQRCSLEGVVDLDLEVLAVVVVVVAVVAVGEIAAVVAMKKGCPCEDHICFFCSRLTNTGSHEAGEGVSRIGTLGVSRSGGTCFSSTVGWLLGELWFPPPAQQRSRVSQIVPLYKRAPLGVRVLTGM